MMKKLLGIVLCCTLLLSCMPAMATVLDGDNVPSTDDVANLYTIDVSGSTPVLKLNGEAVSGENSPALTLRGNVTVGADTDSTGTPGGNVAKLLNSSGDIATYGYTSNWKAESGNALTNNYRAIGSALMVDMGDDKLTGNVLITFKAYDKTYNISKYHLPLIVNKDRLTWYNGDPSFITLWNRSNSGYQRTNIAGSVPNFFTGSSSYIANGAGTATDIGPRIANSAWHDFTVLYNTSAAQFKLWVDGVQYKNTSGGEWFTDGWNNLTEGMQDVIFGSALRVGSDNNLTTATAGMEYYVKDMAFGEYTAPDTTVKDYPVNRISINFDTPTDATAGNKNYKAVATSVASGTQGNAAVDGDDYVVIGSVTNDGTTRETIITQAPATSTNKPNTGSVLKLRNITSNFHGSLYSIAYSDGAEFTENMYVEFDFCNGTATTGTAADRVNPISFGNATYSNYRGTEQMLGFDGTGIYVNETLVKSEDTRNKWYHVKILYAPTADSFRVWIDGVALTDAEGNDWFNAPQALVDATDVNAVFLAVGRARTKAVDATVYFDNFEMYIADNRVDFDCQAVTRNDDTNAVELVGASATNKTDADVIAVPVLAVYDQEGSGVLKKLTIGAPVTVAPGNTVALNASASLEGITTLCKAKAFIWNTTFEGMTPFDADSFFGRQMADGVFTGHNIEPTGYVAE